MPSSRPVVVGIILWLLIALFVPVPLVFADPGLPPGHPAAPPARPYVPRLSPPARPIAPAAPEGPAAASIVVTDPVLDMKVLVLHQPDDEGILAAATAYLDIMGIPYDVIDTSARTIEASDLWDGVNRGYYYAVFVTTSPVWSDLETGETTALVDFERIFGVRQVTWYAYPNPTDYGLEFVRVTAANGDPVWCPGSPHGIPFNATLTTEGQAAFGYLRPDLSLSIQGPCMYGYLAQPAAGADVTPLMVDEAGNTFLAVFRPGDGRETMVMTEGSFYPVIPPGYLHALVLPYGMINWATRGVFLGERHAYFTPQMDDVLEWGDRWDATNHRYILDTGYHTDPADLDNLVAWKNSFKAATPNAAGLKIEMPFNGDGVLDDLDENGQVIPGSLTAKAMQVQSDFTWLNHTYTHRDLNTNQSPYPGYQISAEEILSNSQIAAPSYRLVDGLVNLTGGGEEYLRVSGDYPPGTYRYRGTVTDNIGGSSAMSVSMTFVTTPPITTLALLQSTDKSSWSNVAGNLTGGFRMNLAPTQQFYYLNAPSLTATTPMTDGLHPFLLDTEQLPAGFYDYWAARGVVAGAGSWQALMWEIINGRQPIFYLKVDPGPSYRLVDGLMQLTGQGEEYLRVSGDYPTGTYRYNGTLTDNGGGTSGMSVEMTFGAFPDVLSLSLVESTDRSSWSEVPGDLTYGFHMDLAPSQHFYYLNTPSVTATRPLAEGRYPFLLDTGQLPAGFYEYWAAKGVVEDAGAGTWQAAMWEIINGRQPIFYLKVEPGPGYRLVDGLTELIGQGEEYLRVSGDYPLGTYRYNGTLTDAGGGESGMSVYMTFEAFPRIVSLTLQQSTDKSNWSGVGGSLADGFHMDLAPTQGFYYLNTPGLTASKPLTDTLHPFYLATTSLPAGFYDYWAAKGVVEGAGGWQGIMWQIIHGSEPIFYLKAEVGPGFRLVDGLTHLAGIGEEYLRVSGDYPPGTYKYNGTLTDNLGRTSTSEVEMTFQSLPVIAGLDLRQSTDESTWSSVAGDLRGGFSMNLSPTHEFYYLNAPSLTVSTPISDGLHPFHLDIGHLPVGYYEYWAVKGVVEDAAAGSWQSLMWEIINGRQPILYLEVEPGPSFRLLDGLTHLAGTGDEYLRVSGDYPLGTYRFNGTLTDTGGGTSSLDAYLTFEAFPGITSLNLLESTDKIDWSTVPGDAAAGFRMNLSPVRQFYYLTASAVMANKPLGAGLHPFFLDTTALPPGFYDYWAARGVVSGAGSWQGLMWEIINARLPIFYLKAEPGLLGFVDYDPSALLTGDYSGVSPTNPDLAQAAHDLGVRYIEVNASMAGYNNPSPNTGIPHPTQPSILEVPRYANNIFYAATNPAEETDLYNSIYSCPGWPATTCYDYAYVIDSVTSQALEFLLDFSVNATMFHMNNFDNYGGGRTLLGDFVEALYGKFNAVFNRNVPVLSLRTQEIGQKMRDRMAYDASGVTGQLSCGGQISLHADAAASIPMTGVDYGPNVENYAGQWISHIPMDAHSTLVIPGSPARVAAATTHLTATRSGSDIVLHWPALSQATDGSTLSAYEYRIYARAGAPYFTPSPEDLIGVTTSTSFTQTNVSGLGLGDYTYAVSAVGDNCWKHESAPSNRLSSFVFALVPGQ